MALGAIVHERRFQRGLEPRDATLVDIGLLLFLGRLFDVDVVQGLAVHNRHAQLFGLRCVDQHSLHCCVPRALYRAERRDVSPLERVAGLSRNARTGLARVSSAATPRQAAGALLLSFLKVFQGRQLRPDNRDSARDMFSATAKKPLAMAG